MSELLKTIIVPTADPLAILDQKILKMVVISNDSALVEMANNLSLKPPTAIDRYVIWYKAPDFVELQKQFSSLPDDLTQVKAFSLSTKNKVADVIKADETADYVRIDQSFTKAGLPEYN